MARITSYNVCYTKLLRALRVGELLQASDAVDRAPAVALLDEADWWPRALGLRRIAGAVAGVAYQFSARNNFV